MEQSHRIKHIFIINPNAGKKKTDLLKKDIRAVWDTAGEAYQFYETKATGDGEGYVRKCCEEFAGSKDTRTSSGSAGSPPFSRLRFFACGGDGTLNEVINGSYGYDFVEVGCIPMGTGNDFVRNFPDYNFSDILAQLKGTPTPCDLIRCELSPTAPEDRAGKEDSRDEDRAGGGSATLTRYCVNMINIGFDCSVVDTTDRIKKAPFVSGSFAYLGSVAVNLIKKSCIKVAAVYPDESIYKGNVLLLSIANGSFCGGGIKGLPKARTDDGLMDVSLVKDVSRTTFVKLFPKYQKGTHLEDPRTGAFLSYSQVGSLRVLPYHQNFKICIDGEIMLTGSVNFAVEEKAFAFVLPDR